MDPIVRVGIAGLGRSGWGIHARIFEKIPEMYRVVAVFDQLEERLDEAKGKFGCRIYSDLDPFMADDSFELAVIAMPSYLHAAHTIEALKSGKNVVCEKPMATSLAEADAMIETANQTGRLLTVFHNRRYSPDFLKVKEVINSGRLGRLVLVRICLHSFGRRWDWQTLSKFGGGELRNTGAHAIDQALQIIGDSEPKVSCDLQRTLTLGDAEDHVKIILNAPRSPVVDIEITHACAFPQDYWLVMGTAGGLTGGGNLLRWKYIDPNDFSLKEVDVSPTPDRSYNREELRWIEETWQQDESHVPAEFTFYKELYGALRYGRPLAVTPESARKVMAIIEECATQCRANR